MHEYNIRAEIDQYIDNRPHTTLYEYEQVKAKTMADALSQVEQIFKNKVKQSNIYENGNITYKLTGIRVRIIK